MSKTIAAVSKANIKRPVRKPNFSIPDPGSKRFRIPDPDQHQRISVFSPKKLLLSSRKYDPGCSFWIPDPDPQHCLYSTGLNCYSVFGFPDQNMTIFLFEIIQLIIVTYLFVPLPCGVP
jgi:hypothetical protein